MIADRISKDLRPTDPATTPAQISGDAVLNDAQSFSLVLGGPLYQLLRRAHLSDDAVLMVRRRVVVIALLAWLPLLILSAIQGLVWGKSVAMPFLLDLEVHIRFLIVVPLLVIAELVVHQRMRPIAKAFLDRHLILEDDLPGFDKAITSAFNLRNSVIAEVLLIVIVYGVGVSVVWRQFTGLSADSWYAPASLGGATRSLAGLWYSYASLPIFQFLLIRWYFRIFIWARFLWQVSRINLALVPTHPDRVGGLGFLSNTVYAFSLLVVAHGALISSQIANRIFFSEQSCPNSKLKSGSSPPFCCALSLGRWSCLCHSLGKPSAQVYANMAPSLKLMSVISIGSGCAARNPRMKYWLAALISNPLLIWQTVLKWCAVCD
jgi:hypothetical protein